MRILFEFSEQSVKMTAESGGTFRVDERVWGGSAKIKLYDPAGVPQNVYIITAAGSVIILDEEPTETPFSETPHVDIPDEYTSQDAPQINKDEAGAVSEQNALDTQPEQAEPDPASPEAHEQASGFKAMSQHADETADKATS